MGEEENEEEGVNAQDCVNGGDEVQDELVNADNAQVGGNVDNARGGDEVQDELVNGDNAQAGVNDENDQDNANVDHVQEVQNELVPRSQPGVALNGRISLHRNVNWGFSTQLNAWGDFEFDDGQD